MKSAAELPPGWRQMTVHELRRWIRQSPYHLPYVNWLRRERIVAWLEANVERVARP